MSRHESPSQNKMTTAKWFLALFGLLCKSSIMVNHNFIGLLYIRQCIYYSVYFTCLQCNNIIAIYLTAL